VRHILRQVCGALEEAHQQGIVHRDLKPDNVVLTHRADEPDFVKVLDFGIALSTGPTAKRQTKLTQQGTVLGTPPYMSPEQLAGEEVDSRSDVYSLGVIAYEMLTGKLPFEAETPWQWANKHMREKPRPLTTVTDRPIPAEMEQAAVALAGPLISPRTCSSTEC
jgi:serine/threonine-protein kinase